MFWMYSVKLRKVVRLSDPLHFDHILTFLCPEDIPHRIDLSTVTYAPHTRMMETRWDACQFAEHTFSRYSFGGTNRPPLPVPVAAAVVIDNEKWGSLRAAARRRITLYYQPETQFSQHRSGSEPVLAHEAAARVSHIWTDESLALCHPCLQK